MVEHKERNRLTSMSFKRSDCAIACVLDLLGDKWTLLIIRDLFFGKTRYKDFHESNEKIPTNILAGRLATTATGNSHRHSVPIGVCDVP